jgi:glycosyltransferase involved in cell wall biosynthesis
MIKNESHILRRCIESIKPLIDYFVFVDTGSTDSTIEVINEILKDLPGEVHQTTWKNFGYNRTEALAFCKGIADYTCVVDADDIWKIEKRPKLKGDCIKLYVNTGKESFDQIRLLKGDLDWKYVGVRHAYPDTTGRTIIQCDKSIWIRSTQDGASWQDPQKFLKNGIELETSYLENKDPRTLFYAAMSYKDAGEYDRAKELFTERAKLGGWAEEIWYSVFSTALMDEDQMKLNDAILGYFGATNIDNTRAENLTSLARCFRKKKQYVVGYMLAKKAMELKKPKKLFILDAMYGPDLWDEFAICAYYIGDYNNAAAYMRKVLKENITPEARERIQKNLKFAEEKLDESRRINHGKERSAHNRTMPKKRS